MTKNKKKTKYAEYFKTVAKVFICCALPFALLISAYFVSKMPDAAVLWTKEHKRIAVTFTQKLKADSEYAILLWQKDTILLKKREYMGNDTGALQGAAILSDNQKAESQKEGEKNGEEKEPLTVTLPSSSIDWTPEKLIRAKEADAVGVAVDDVGREWEEVTGRLTEDSEFAVTETRIKEDKVFTYANKNAEIYYCSIEFPNSSKGIFITSSSPEYIDIFNYLVNL